MKSYQVIIEPEAGQDLENIYDFIVTNDTQVHKLQKTIDSLNFMPERCRKSIYIQDKNTHNMIHQGYTICYVVEEERVHILTVFRQRAS